jgi:hypothetical protein
MTAVQGSDLSLLFTSENFQFKYSLAFNQFITKVFQDSQNRPARQSSANPYALLPDALAFLEELIDRKLPSTIVEFGSGESTLIFSAWAEAAGASVITVENEKSWLTKIKEKVSQEFVTGWKSIHAPLHLEFYNFRLFFTYSLPEGFDANFRKSDIVLIDGPHIPGREAVLYKALNNCKADGIIIMDDFNIAPIRKMLASVPADLASHFNGIAVESCGRGFYIIQCIEPVSYCKMPPPISFYEVAISYWRTVRDYLRFGAGR